MGHGKKTSTHKGFSPTVQTRLAKKKEDEMASNMIPPDTINNITEHTIGISKDIINPQQLTMDDSVGASKEFEGTKDKLR